MTITALTHPTPLRYAGSLMTWHAAAQDTGGAFALGHVVVRPGGEPPLHVHAREDELFYVISGEVTFQRGLERIDRGPGESILLPRGIQHGFAIRSPEATMLFVLSPGGLDEAFRELSEPAVADAPAVGAPAPPSPEEQARMTSVFGAHGVEFTGPPLAALLDG